LFERQKQLNAALSRQARLAKLAVAEVCSTEAEHLRMVNQAMLDATSSVRGSKNPFRQRNLTDAQLLAEDMVRRQGARFGTDSGSATKQPRPSKWSERPHRKQAPTDNKGQSHARLEECFTLRGPLLRDFARAKERGYKGPPSRWLKGPQAARSADRLLRKGMTFPLPCEASIFDRASPLYWAVNSSSGIRAHNLGMVSRPRGYE
jgi:hypothetical protein